MIVYGLFLCEFCVYSSVYSVHSFKSRNQAIKNVQRHVAAITVGICTFSVIFSRIFPLGNYYLKLKNLGLELRLGLGLGLGIGLVSFLV